jgi:transcriptional regulator with XRE-family HTH domain
MKDLKKKPYREAFVRSQINIGIPFQVRALREKKDWKQEQLAEASSMLQPRISAIERPGGSKLNLETLLRLAAAFDVGLVVRFVPFSEMLRWAKEFRPDTFQVPSFNQEQMVEAEHESAPERSTTKPEQSGSQKVDNMADWIAGKSQEAVLKVQQTLSIPNVSASVLAGGGLDYAASGGNPSEGHRLC